MFLQFQKVYNIFTHMKPANISKQRIMAQAKKLKLQKLPYLAASPMEDDIYTWHFTFLGPENTDFHEGIYHGQILLPYEYPFKPPDIIFMNKNGRFETNTKICLSITQYHPQEWNSAWTIRTMLEAVVSLFAQNVQGIGALTSTSDVRIFLAKSSHSFVCEKCGPIKSILTPRLPSDVKPAVAQKIEESAVEEIKVQRKLSEDKKVSGQLLNFKRNYSEDQRKLVFQKHHNVQSHILSSKREGKSIPQIIERPCEEEPVHSNQKGPEIIYIKDRHPIANEYNNLSNTVKIIQNNLQKLDYINSTIKWVN